MVTAPYADEFKVHVDTLVALLHLNTSTLANLSSRLNAMLIDYGWHTSREFFMALDNAFEGLAAVPVSSLVPLESSILVVGRYSLKVFEGASSIPMPHPTTFRGEDCFGGDLEVSYSRHAEEPYRSRVYRNDPSYRDPDDPAVFAQDMESYLQSSALHSACRNVAAKLASALERILAEKGTLSAGFPKPPAGKEPANAPKTGQKLPR